MFFKQQATREVSAGLDRAPFIALLTTSIPPRPAGMDSIIAFNIAA